MEENVDSDPKEKNPKKKSEKKEENKYKTETQSEKKSKQQQETSSEKTEKTEEKKEKTAGKKISKGKEEHKKDFRYIVRIANTDIDGEKKLIHGLTSIKGVGMHTSTLIVDQAGINRDIKIGNLTDAQIEKIKSTLNNLNQNAPGWMLNHRKDYDTGEDIHLVGSEIDMQLRDEINIMKKIRSYKGIRHEANLPVRGQRTRGNGRKGLSLGVSRKAARAAAAKKE